MEWIISAVSQTLCLKTSVRMWHQLLPSHDMLLHPTKGRPLLLQLVIIWLQGELELYIFRLVCFGFYNPYMCM